MNKCTLNFNASVGDTCFAIVSGDDGLRVTEADVVRLVSDCDGTYYMVDCHDGHYPTAAYDVFGTAGEAKIALAKKSDGYL